MNDVNTAPIAEHELNVWLLLNFDVPLRETNNKWLAGVKDALWLDHENTESVSIALAIEQALASRRTKQVSS